MSSSSQPAPSPGSATPASPTPSQRSGFPFPDTRSRQASTQHYRRGSTASQTSTSASIGGTLDIHPRRGNPLRETNHNAISTLLQPPIVRTGLLPHTAATAAAAGYKPPSQKDIPPVTLTNIDHIPPESFRDYLSRIGPLFDSFQRGRAEPEAQPQWLKKDKELERTDRFAEALERRMSWSSIASPTATPATPRIPTSATLSPLETPKRRARRNRNEPPPLSTIPTVYFDEHFHLENPRTFDVVSERAEIVRPLPGVAQQAANGAPRKALATNAILQEKLSWYMDTVEIHLINSISTASTGFFAALGSLKQLQTEAKESVERIQSLREDLRRLDREVAVRGLDVAAKRRRGRNLEILGKATRQVERVVEEVKRADGLVEEGMFEEAVVGMEGIGRLVCGQSEVGKMEKEDLVDLRPLKALQGLDSGLQELQMRIGNGFSNRFTSALMQDLRQHVDRVPSTDTLKRWSRQRGIPPLYMETNVEFRTKLLDSLKGLQRVGHTAPAAAAYRDAVNKEMKSIIRKYLPSSNDDDADSIVSTATSTGGGRGKLSQQEKSSILARNLRAMDPEDAEKLLINIYTGVSEALRRVATQTKILLDLTSSVQAPAVSSAEAKSPPPTPGTPNRRSLDDQLTKRDEADASHALDLSSLLEQAVDTAQTQITRVLKVRNEQTVRLPRTRFLRYFALNRLFADECEAVSGSGGQALKGIINAQISGFVQVLGREEIERVSGLLDADTWNARDFGEGDEEVLQRVLGSMSRDPAEWGGGKAIWEDVDEKAEDSSALMNGDLTTNGIATPNGQPPPPATANKTTTTAKPAHIDSTRYILVHSVISLLPTIESFLSLTTSLPTMTPQISTALLEILRTFNSRSCQLILGAGATRSAGLKNITTKHLALASQGLSFIIALVPYLRECVRRHLPAGQQNTTVLAEWDKCKRLYQDHQMGIHDKLVEIMTTRSLAHVKAMKAIDFSSTPEKDSDIVSPYVETLTKETLTLHRVLARHLNEVDVGMIMRRVFEEYRVQWTEAFRGVPMRGEVGEKALLRDAEVLVERLGKIEGFDAVGKEVIGLVKARAERKSSGEGEE